MILDTLHAVLTNFYETVVGLRTAQVGRANNNLAHLLDYLANQLERLPQDARHRAGASINAMLHAREHNDAIGLADIIQYELPVLLQDGEISPTLFDLDLIARLRALDRLVSRPDGFDMLDETLRTLQQAYPQALGLTNYHAAQLYRLRRFADARALLLIDDEAGRQSPLGSCALALLHAREGDFARATALVVSAYRRCSTLYDAFAELGWIKAQTLDWQGALQLAMRDERAGRLTPAWRLNIALLYGRQDDFARATDMMDAAYRKSDMLHDGFARLGWIKAEAGDWSGALELAIRDERADRLSPAWQINLAQLYGQQGDFDSAATLILRAYRNDASVRDGFARLGWIKTARCDWCEAYNLMARDSDEGRISPAWAAQMAVVETYLGRCEAAVSRVLDAYAADPALCDALGRLGWHGYLLGKGVEYLRMQIDRDVDLGRDATMGEFYAAFYAAATGAVDDAERQTTESYARYPDQRDWFSSMGWLMVRQGDPTAGSLLMYRDYDAGRMTPYWYPSLALALYMADRRPQALGLLQRLTDTPLPMGDLAIGYPTLPDQLIAYEQLAGLITRETVNQQPERLEDALTAL